MPHAQSGKPTVLFVGHGRAGKDEAAVYLSRISGLRYTGSFSWAALPYMADYFGEHPQVVWEERHKKREIWKRELDLLRQKNQCYLARLALTQGEVAAGLRDRLEIDAVKSEGLFDHIVWIHRHKNPIDPTVTFLPTDCSEVIYNNGTLEEFHEAIWEWAFSKRIPLK